MEILMEKTLSGHLAPINEEEAELMKKLKLGGIVECKITNKRNPGFHRKFFALLKVGYDAWTETSVRPMYQGMPVQPSMERFRKDVTILAGHYTATYNLKGEVRLEAESISFANMDQDVFEELFSSVINVLLRGVLSNGTYTEESLRQHVDRVLAFDR